MIEINKIHLGNNIDLIQKIDNDSVGLCVSSPPYKEEDGFNVKNICFILSQIYRVLKPNSLFFLNFGHLSFDKFRPFQVCQYAIQRGFALRETFTWIKNHYTPIQGNKRVNNLTEFIFMFSKGDMPNIDRLSIGRPYSDITNAKRYNNGINLRCAGNVWFINYPTRTRKDQILHKDAFPLELPEKCIKLSGIKKGIVFDPWVGSGSTLLAAKNLGLDYLGFEIIPKYHKIAVNRINNNISQNCGLCGKSLGFWDNKGFWICDSCLKKD